MNKKVMYIIQTIKDILKSITKQKLIFIMSILAAITGIIYVCLVNNFNLSEIFENIFKAFLFGTFCSISISFLTNKIRNSKIYFIQISAVTLITAGMYILLNFVTESSFRNMYFLGLSFAVLCFTIFILVPEKNNNSYYANLIKYLSFCEDIVIAGTAGCYLLTQAFSVLIVDIDYDIMEKILLSLFIFFQVVVFINLYTFYIFEKKEEPSGKLFKVLFMYIQLPVYILLLAVLYAYLIKMFVTWTIPEGQINWFVSFASVFYMEIYFVLKEYSENRIMKIFYRFGALILIPLIVIQFWACFIRLNAYGFTGWRYSSLLFNFFAAVFVIFTFIKNGRFVKYAIPVLGLLVISASLTPINLIDVAYNSQMKRMTKIMDKYGLMKNGEFTHEKNENLEQIIEDEDRENLVGAWEYITYTSEHKKPEWLYSKDTNDNYSFEETFNIHRNSIYKNLIEKEEYFNLLSNSIDITGFSKIKKFVDNYYKYSTDIKKENESNRVILIYNNFDATDYLLNYQDKKEPLVIDLENGDRILFDSIKFTYNNEKKSFEDYQFCYYVLYK